MSDFLVSARKYRPVNFEDVVGQHTITSTLKNAISNKKLAQALLFTGPRGVGKTSCARIVAREINNFKINDDNSYNIFELDAASNNGVEGIRNLIDQTRIPPQTGKYKVYIIDEVHMLSSGAFNAFLKTLEEPPSHCIFILATTEKHKIIPTILSRCQIYNFKRITIDDIVSHLKKICKIEKIQFEDEALKLIASKCDGAMRDALQLFDKVVGINKNISSQMVLENLNSIGFDAFLEIVNLINKKNIPDLINAVNSILDQGISGDLFLSGLSSFFRDILVSKNKVSHKLLNLDDTKINKLSDLGSDLNYDFLIEYIAILNEAEINFQKSINQRLLVELAILKISSLESDDKKKKFKYKLIPISSFQSQVFKSHHSKINVQKKSKPIADINLADFETSTLSLKSIEKDKDFTDISSNIEEAEYNLEKNITHKEISDTWNEYVDKQEDKGRYNIASILRISEPKFKDDTIIYSVPNNTAAIELEQEKQQLILFIRRKLDSKINISLEIDKSIDKKVAYTNKEKYELLKKKNPIIEVLRNQFKLSI